MQRLARSRGQPSAGVSNPNTPRNIRARLAAPRRRGEPSEAAMVAPDSPTQQVARSAAGKTALGPWTGSFGGIGEVGGALDGADPPSPTLFATSQGAVFADLQGSPVASGEFAEEAGAAVTAAAAADAPAHADAQRMERMVARAEMGVLRRKAEGTRVRCMMGPRPNVARRRMRMIGQARKHN